MAKGRPHRSARPAKPALPPAPPRAAGPAAQPTPITSLVLYDHLRKAIDRGEYDAATDLIAPLLSGRPETARESARGHLTRLAVAPTPEPLTAADKCAFALSCDVATSALTNYATLCETHIHDIERLIREIADYVDDRSRSRPLNSLMMASPGAGKSHFIECVARQLRTRNVASITFNMASMRTSDDLIKPLDEARNAKVEDRIPLIFFDEFDSNPANYSLLLPLLWDGTLSLGQRDLRLGRVIIVLAGSSQTLPQALGHAKSMRKLISLPDGTHPKLIDLVSRINGPVITIPPFHDPSAEVDRRVDKVAVAVQLLRHRFGPSLQLVTTSLFRLIANLRFRYDVRSIATLINLIPYTPGTTRLAAADLKLPMTTTHEVRNSSLAYHLIDDDDNAHGIVGLYQWATGVEEAVPVRPLLSTVELPLTDPRMAVAYLIHRVGALPAPR